MAMHFQTLRVSGFTVSFVPIQRVSDFFFFAFGAPVGRAGARRSEVWLESDISFILSFFPSFLLSAAEAMLFSSCFHINLLIIFSHPIPPPICRLASFMRSQRENRTLLAI